MGILNNLYDQKNDDELDDAINVCFYEQVVDMALYMIDELGIEVPDDKAKELGFGKGRNLYDKQTV